MVKKKLLLMILVLSISLFCGTIYARTQVSVTNQFETGIVDIELSEYQKKGDTEVLWTDNPTVLPGDKISKIPRIHNDGNDCYVRAKVNFRGTADVNDGDLFGIGKDWVKADDGFYYYKKILPTGGDVDLFQGIHIPKKLPQEVQEKIFYVDIDADAIQSKNFSPDFKAAMPWGSVEILACEKEGMYDVSEFKRADTKSFQIVYQGDSAKLIKNEDDFFVNFPYLMPGDVYSDDVKLNNNSKTDIKLYFRSEALDKSTLLDKILLTITTNVDGKEKVVYDGNLRAKELSEEVALGIIPAGADGDFHFEISVPSELNNKYTILDSDVRWIFSTEPIKDVVPVDTGDKTILGIYLVLMISSAFGLFMVSRKRKEDECDDQVL